MIHINIVAPAGCGKTTVSLIIQKALEEAGFTVENYDIDSKSTVVLENIENLIKTVVSRESIQIDSFNSISMK